MSKVTGECLCHGIVVHGSLGTVAQPEPYWHIDVWTGQRIKCVAVLDGGVHDVPMSWPRGVERLTDEPTVITEEE